MAKLPHDADSDPAFETSKAVLPTAWDALLSDFAYSSPFDDATANELLAWTFAPTATTASAPSAKAEPTSLSWAGERGRVRHIGDGAWLGPATEHA